MPASILLQPRPRMRSYIFQLEDARHAVASTLYVAMPTDGRARARATEFLLQSQHHKAVHVFDGRQYLFSVNRGAAPVAQTHGYRKAKEGST